MRARSFFAAAFACALTAVAPASATAGKLDQQQTTQNGVVTITGPNHRFGLIGAAQTFTPELSGMLDQVDLLIAQDASGPLTVQIRNVAGGFPGPSVLASASVPAAAVPVLGPGTFIAVPFASPAPVLAGNQYAIFAYTGGADEYWWYGINSNPYAGGAVFYSQAVPPVTWLSSPGTDLAFKTYVDYPFAGFFSPVDNPPIVNAAKAGSSVPVKFSLGGDQGLGVLAVGYPSSQQYDCNSDDPIDPIEATTTANTGLTYDPFTDEYTYVWKTDKAWRGQCRTLTVGLDDDTTHTADFKLK